MVTSLGWKLFITFATINIFGGCVFILFLPETKGRSLEEMDIIFGAVSREKREADVARAERDLEGIEGTGRDMEHGGASSSHASVGEKGDPESAHIEKSAN